jgi:hypothetical protein
VDEDPDEDPGLRIGSFAVKLSTNKTIIYFIAMQTYKELNITIVVKIKLSTLCMQLGKRIILDVKRI